MVSSDIWFSEEEKFYHDFFSRVDKLFSEEDFKKIVSTKIFIAGVGGVGSTTAYFLSRSGFRHFLLIDPDIVQTCNLGHQTYFYNDVGSSKVKALRRTILRINPFAHVEIYDKKIVDLIENGVLEKLIKKSDIVIDGVDDILTKAYLSRLVKRIGKPLVNASQFGGGARVTIFIPNGPYYEEAFNLPTRNLGDEVLLSYLKGERTDNMLIEEIKKYIIRAFSHFSNSYISEKLLIDMMKDTNNKSRFIYIPGISQIVGIVVTAEILKLVLGKEHIKYPEIIHIDLWELTLKKDKASSHIFHK